MNIADLVITINQTKEEIDDGIMRLYVAKNRNGPRYKTVKIQTSFDRMCFYQPIGV
jgi:replicative DNA helicase